MTIIQGTAKEIADFVKETQQPKNETVSVDVYFDNAKKMFDDAINRIQALKSQTGGEAKCQER